ncbi:MAG TPA: nuclear transport factor 2 family protein [Acidobacteriota bacterium]|nr:nuclear transport factor 2 family protein [Acidobacteriota bacterium]
MNITRMVRISAIAISILAAGCGRLPDKQAASFQNYIDRQAIETTLVRYSTGLDTFDADVYASTFTEDAEFIMEGKVFRGRDEIRKIITDMKASRAARLEDKDPANDPPPIMHHVMSNAVIDIVGADSARHRCYWMTVSGGPKLNSFHVAAEGRYEDELVKRGGEWLIHRRKIVE